eukprot:c30388_g1_i1 orf=2-226(+)
MCCSIFPPFYGPNILGSMIIHGYQTHMCKHTRAHTLFSYFFLQKMCSSLFPPFHGPPILGSLAIYDYRPRVCTH